MEPSAFGEAIDRHYPGLVQRLTLVLRDGEEAKDVAQETYLRAYRSWARFDGTDARAWLHTIALRLAFNALRRRRRWLAAMARRRGDASAAWVTPERIDLWKALDALEASQRAALLLNVLDGYTQAEIATMLEVPAGTVAGWIADAKHRLRRQLGEDVRAAQGGPADAEPLAEWLPHAVPDGIDRFPQPNAQRVPGRGRRDDHLAHARRGGDGQRCGQGTAWVRRARSSWRGARGMAQRGRPHVVRRHHAWLHRDVTGNRRRRVGPGLRGGGRHLRTERMLRSRILVLE
ncbi:MAG: RNA polymerase sigma factor [Chloroflexota bacterium]|nr:RNA polymerase sigma factor [Chloroflexota bacterium]